MPCCVHGKLLGISEGINCALDIKKRFAVSVHYSISVFLSKFRWFGSIWKTFGRGRMTVRKSIPFFENTKKIKSKCQCSFRVFLQLG